MSLCIQSPERERERERENGTALINVIKYHSTTEFFFRSSSCPTNQELETEVSKPL
jgi:hypothetical protein